MAEYLLGAIFFPFIFALFFGLFERYFPRFLGLIAMIAPVVSTLSLIGVTQSMTWYVPAVVDIPWIPILGINLSFLVDGLSLFFGFLVSGMGILVMLYSQSIMTHRKKHLGRFYALLLFFMTSMLGAVFSNNLLLLFVFWELTSVASFLLIGFHYEDPKAVEGGGWLFW